jgi:hypothetical protein
MTVEIKLAGLNARQKVLANIMWSIEEWTDVEQFIATLPKRERAECESIVDLMKMELVESYRKGMGITDTPDANKVIDRFRLTK